MLSYWTDKVPLYGWVLIAWAFYQCVSFLGVLVYGELEFWLALWKIICLLVTFLLAILCNTGAIGGDYIGFRFWKTPGPVLNGINGFGQSFVLAAVYYCGTELVAITAGESRTPNKDIPKVSVPKISRLPVLDNPNTPLGNQANSLSSRLYLLGYDLLRWHQRSF